MMEKRYDSFCGLYCGACDIFLANEAGSVNQLAESWDISPEELRCRGCKSRAHAYCCRDCTIRQCATGRQVEYCYQCVSYPCSRLMSFRYDIYPHHSIVLYNLACIERQGIAQWLRDQKDRWSCHACKAAFSWYEQTCSNCSETLYSCIEEETAVRHHS